jgi:Uma2 family endonuclease
MPYLAEGVADRDVPGPASPHRFFAVTLKQGHMPVELGPAIELPVPPHSPVIYPPRKRWTRAECQSLEATGLWDRDRLELIEGELIVKMSRRRPHTVVYTSVLEWLAGMFGMKHLNPEAPIDVAPEDNPTSEPEPDIAVMTKTGSEYPGANPPASDVRLVIEVSDSTLAFDLGPKARLYARAGIPEYWVFDIGGRRLIVHRYPQAGSYSAVTAYAEGESVTPFTLPASSFPVAVAFPFPRG